MKKIYLLLAGIFMFLLGACSTPDIAVVSARVDMRENPVGLDLQNPCFMWQISSRLPGIMQTAYRIQVAESPQNLLSGNDLLWDTGEVESDRTTFIPYEGPELESRKTYYWRVMSVTNQGASEWSNVAQWSMALMSDSDWQASWIGLDRSDNETDCLVGKTRLAARYLRKEFNTESKVRQAVLYVTGLGFYEAYMNGRKIGNDVFAPTATDYSKTVNYNVFDVTAQVRKGENTIGVILGNGRFFSMRTADPSLQIPVIRNFGFPKMLLQLELTYEDGRTERVVSDDTWKITTHGPIVANSEFDGEEYNANLEMPGWNENNFDDSAWLPVEKVASPGGKLVAQRNPNITTQHEVHPVSVRKTSRGTYILDMGQNMVGWLSVKLPGKKDNPVKMVFAEVLKDSGDELYMDNLRGALVTDVYTPAENGVFEWEPRFTYHGFRYVELYGLEKEPSLNSFVGKVNYDKMELTGTFETSNPLINRIYENACWGFRGNYRSMPTDCPQRDERMGWLGDRATGCFAEAFVFNQDLLYEKWAHDIMDAQLENGSIPDVAPNYWSMYSDNVTWPAAYMGAIEMLYRQYGNPYPIIRHYDSMKRWVELMTSDLYMKDYIISRDVYGDWCMPPERQELIHSQDPARKTDGGLLGTSFMYRILNFMQTCAKVSGHESDCEAYAGLAAKMKEAYNKTYFNEEGKYYVNNTVTANMLSLMLGLVPEGCENDVFRHIVDKTVDEFDSHVSTGLIGIQYLMRGLTAYGASDLAYTIATNETYPSWGYMVSKDATTIWELWNGDTADPAMNSGNHVMLLGDLLIWYYENLAGIRTDSKEVGFRRIEMAPIFPEELDYVKASYNSVQGEIRSSWKKEGNRITWEVTVPCNTTAEITLPAKSLDQVTVDNRSVADNNCLTVLESGDGKDVKLEAVSGSYSFVVMK